MTSTTDSTLPCVDPACCDGGNTFPDVRVYRSPVAGARLFVGEGYKHTAQTGGWVIFARAGNPKPHPHNRDELAYPYGEFCTGDECLVAKLDKLLADKLVPVMFFAVEQPNAMDCA